MKNTNPEAFGVLPCLQVDDDETLNAVVSAIDEAATIAAPLYKLRAYTDIMNVGVERAGQI